MRKIIFALLLGISSAVSFAQAAKPLDLADGAPDRYIVVPGDTLWSISTRFLKDPYRWGELWKLNAEEIKNPQRIYPGQVIALDKSGNQPQLKLETIVEPRRVYVEPIRKGVPSIPAQDIEPFLSEPRVIDVGDSLAYIRPVRLAELASDDPLLPGSSDGTGQAVGVVTDVGLFLELLSKALAQ